MPQSSCLRSLGLRGRSARVQPRRASPVSLRLMSSQKRRSRKRRMQKEREAGHPHGTSAGREPRRALPLLQRQRRKISTKWKASLQRQHRVVPPGHRGLSATGWTRSFRASIPASCMARIPVLSSVSHQAGEASARQRFPASWQQRQHAGASRSPSWTSILPAAMRTHASAFRALRHSTRTSICRLMQRRLLPRARLPQTVSRSGGPAFVRRMPSS